MSWLQRLAMIRDAWRVFWSRARAAWRGDDRDR